MTTVHRFNAAAIPAAAVDPMAAYDFTRLYTNIPLDDLCRSIDKLARTCLEGFAGIEICGIPIGISAASFIANLFLGWYEFEFLAQMHTPMSDEHARLGLPLHHSYYPRTADFRPVVIVYELAYGEQLPDRIGSATVSVPGGNAVRVPVFRAVSFRPPQPQPQQLPAVDGMAQ
ncbi:hypothetical protein GPECTOR_1255g512 [Gonium pectorale]|uniref:Uncharacterized protein n=1 Tax=Gonium pectorale TaxID=33097 RepID=A0A150FTH9_GONPE|nr:hypothetical protein GPECTOR_1255g512 [Gonium pectorale]|eukprot:KXZ40933.1 hypothetical protein GPECTOR_1255g512 [Gonium pectorale]